MWTLFKIFLLTALCFNLSSPNAKVYDFNVRDIQGNELSLEAYKGKVLLIVNVSNQCKHTKQYEDLQELYETYASEGLEILAFPSGDFGEKKVQTDEEINSFCTQKYGITFPLFSKIKVSGEEAHPLYRYLTQRSENGHLNAKVAWNFQKFLVNRNGEVVRSFSPSTKVDNKGFQAALKLALAQAQP